MYIQIAVSIQVCVCVCMYLGGGGEVGYVEWIMGHGVGGRLTRYQRCLHQHSLEEIFQLQGAEVVGFSL